MDPFGEFLELAGLSRSVEETGRRRRQSSLSLQGGSGPEPQSSGSSGTRGMKSEWEEKDWMEAAEAMRGATVEERASLVKVMEERFGSSRPELLERVLSALQAPCGFSAESQRLTSTMTSGLNVTEAGAIEGAGPSRKRKLNLDADEDSVPEGPHKVLIQEDTLDKILSFLDRETQRTARQVCPQWKGRVLANFHKTQILVLQSFGKNKKEDVSILSSVDERMLSSIMILSSIKILSCDKQRFTRILNYLQSSGKLGLIRVLTMRIMDEQSLDAFIQLVNEGRFRGLEKLAFIVQLNSRKKKFKCLSSVASGALPCLKSLDVCVNLTAGQEKRFRNEHLPVVLQSFVSAAPKLEDIRTRVYLDLSGREVKTLYIDTDLLLRDGEVVQMINSVKDSLVNLDLGDCSAQVPFLSNLETFGCCGNDIDIPNPFDLNTVPGLKSLELPFNYLPKLLSPAKNLREITLEYIPIPKTDVLPTLVEPFNFILNADVDRLVLRFRWITISQLLKLLELVNVKERVAEERRTSSVLVFQNMLYDDHIYEEDETNEYDVQTFSAILEMVGRNWGRVLLKDFMFVEEAPDWTETELCWFAGRKKGVARISEGETVYLEIKE